MSELTKLSSWTKLSEHFSEISKVSIKQLFEKDPNRAKFLTKSYDGVLFDFSKNHIERKTIDLLCKLADERRLGEKIEAMFSGKEINFTERRPVLHIALRNLSNEPIRVGGWDVMPKVNAVLHKMKVFTQNIHNGLWRGFSGERITDIVNIGIGGSDLGPRLVCKALEHFRQPDIRAHFVSNVDGSEILSVLKNLNPAKTLFVIASKSFTTPETLLNAETAKKWFLKNGSAETSDIQKHFVALSTNEEACRNFGIPPENMFHFWNWVGGRFSLWSAIGLVISLYLGFDNFYDLLSGAFEIDNHFRKSSFEDNIPVIMGLLGIWYNNFFGFGTYGIIPYDTRLGLLPNYLQQLIMESNGKTVDENGEFVEYPTSPVVWGGVGTDCQHSFFQLLHQGSQIVPLDFLAPIEPTHPFENHHEMLIANFLAQSEALALGKTKQQAEEELQNSGLPEEETQALLPHKIFRGNRPSTTILFDKLTPKTLGKLLATYEHKVFVEGAVWGINSFDQFGVELGKQLAKNLLSKIQNNTTEGIENQSTKQLLEYFLSKRRSK